jgi:ABC-type cobalamin/Fe3+-siderophores transport system ATPase subunit
LGGIEEARHFAVPHEYYDLATCACARPTCRAGLRPQKLGGIFVRLSSIVVRNLNGIDLIDIQGLSDVIVFAGPNGVGKTRLISALIDFFRNLHNRDRIQLGLEATNSWERETWQNSKISTSDNAALDRLRITLQRSQRRNRYRSTVLNFDSNRAIAQIRPFSFSWEIQDPFEEEVGWDMSYSFLRDRFQDVTDSLFKLVEGQRRKIAADAVRLRAEGATNMPLDFPDPIKVFKQAFYQLLAPKELADIDARKPGLFYTIEGKTFSVETLSSGEREVMNIVFDFILRNPSDCIVFFDEPELHLHPELSYKLLQTLSSIGQNNQFIFCTHSPEIITASIENSVVFLKASTPEHSNQAISVSRDDETHHALNLLGQSIGIISLGKKLLLIEGGDSSLDKQTYGAILRNEFPELVMVPSGGKSTIRSFNDVRDSVLNRTIWGVEFFMLCDRDAMLEIGPESIAANLSERLQVLPRYHLENYFLDELLLVAAFNGMELTGSWLQDTSQIRERLRTFAKEATPYAVALKVAASARESVGNVSIMPGSIGQTTSIDQLIGLIVDRVGKEKQRVDEKLDLGELERIAREEYDRLHGLFASDSDAWKRDIPGRIVFNRFAAAAQIKPGRLKNLYLREAQSASPDPFAEIREIFRRFRSVANRKVS